MLTGRPSYVSIGDGFDRPCLIGCELVPAKFGAPYPRTILWNGWIAFPFFDRRTAQLIVDEINGDPANTDRFRWEGDILILEHIEEDDPAYREEQIELTAILTREGQVTYGYVIGGMSWVWEEGDFRCEPGCPHEAGGDHLEDCIAPREEPVKA